MYHLPGTTVHKYDVAELTVKRIDKRINLLH